MTPGELRTFVTGAIGVCAIGVILNLLFLKRRGTSALLMASAFLVLGLTLVIYRAGGAAFLVNTGAAAVVAILAGDFYLRAGNVRQKR